MRVYVDTLVFGECFDEEFKKWPIKLMKEFQSRMKIAVISDLTLRELEEAAN